MLNTMTKKKLDGVVAPRKMKQGTHARLSPRLLQNIITSLQGGNYITATCEWVGIKQPTFYGWMQRGEAEVERVNLAGYDAEDIVLEAISVEIPADADSAEQARLMNQTKAIEAIFDWAPTPFKPEEWKYVLFRTMATRARASAEVRAVAMIQTAAASGNWQAAAWYLERTAPDKWGRRERIQHEGPGGGPVQVDHAVVTLEDLERRLTEVAGEVIEGELEA